MDLHQIKGNTYWIDATETIPCFLPGKGEIILLDSGWGSLDRKGLSELLRRLDRRVVGIMNTHAHIDHNGNNVYFKEKDGAVIAMPLTEAALTSSPLMLKAYYYMLSPRQVPPELGDMVGPTDILIKEGDTVQELCGVPFEVLQLPGHSPGHIGIATPDNVLYLGDALIGEKEVQNARLPVFFSHEADLESKKKLYSVSYEKYALAHSGVYDDIRELLDLNLTMMEDRTREIRDLVTGPMSAEEIIAAVGAALKMNIWRPMRAQLLERDVRSFLNYLLDRGDLTLSIDRGILKYSKAGGEPGKQGNTQ
ncbi:MBL fold metallo-hydrolase [Papillibacter cinnamivorans]|nr:MBL fold metallo-hydrolase [Papillibacter cinnamivorans]